MADAAKAPAKGSGGAGIYMGIAALFFVGLARLFTANVPIDTGYSKNSLGDNVSKGIAHGLMRYIALVMSFGAMAMAGLGALISIVVFLQRPKTAGNIVKFAISLALLALAARFGLLVFRSVTR